jgi:hypothetical protein
MPFLCSRAVLFLCPSPRKLSCSITVRISPARHPGASSSARASLPRAPRPDRTPPAAGEPARRGGSDRRIVCSWHAPGDPATSRKPPEPRASGGAFGAWRAAPGALACELQPGESDEWLRQQCNGKGEVAGTGLRGGRATVRLLVAGRREPPFDHLRAATTRLPARSGPVLHTAASVRLPSEPDDDRCLCTGAASDQMAELCIPFGTLAPVAVTEVIALPPVTSAICRRTSAEITGLRSSLPR